MSRRQRRRENKELLEKISRCAEEYCFIHKRKKIAKCVLTDLLHPIDVVPECPECAAEAEKLKREIALSTRRVI